MKKGSKLQLSKTGKLMTKLSGYATKLKAVMAVAGPLGIGLSIGLSLVLPSEFKLTQKSFQKVYEKLDNLSAQVDSLPGKIEWILQKRDRKEDLENSQLNLFKHQYVINNYVNNPDNSFYEREAEHLCGEYELTEILTNILSRFETKEKALETFKEQYHYKTADIATDTFKIFSLLTSLKEYMQICR
eukprot:Pgem_evm1s6016